MGILGNIFGEFKRMSKKVDDHDKKVAAWKNANYQERVLAANQARGWRLGEERANQEIARRKLEERRRIEETRRQKARLNNAFGLRI